MILIIYDIFNFFLFCVLCFNFLTTLYIIRGHIRYSS